MSSDPSSRPSEGSSERLSFGSLPAASRDLSMTPPQELAPARHLRLALVAGTVTLGLVVGGVVMIARSGSSEPDPVPVAAPPVATPTVTPTAPVDAAEPAKPVAAPPPVRRAPVAQPAPKPKRIAPAQPAAHKTPSHDVPKPAARDGAGSATGPVTSPTAVDPNATLITDIHQVESPKKGPKPPPRGKQAPTTPKRP